MSATLAEAHATLHALLADSEHLVKAVASGRQRNATVPFRRVELRYVDLAVGRRLQLTSYDDTQAHTRNVELNEPAETEIGALLAEPYSRWHLQTTTETVQLRVSKRGRPLLHRGLTQDQVVDRAHDRSKQRRLDASDPVFHLLGVTTADGRVKPTRVAKFRQVQDLLTLLDPVIDSAITLGPGPELSVDRPLRVVDLGCGNAYLTFATFRYLTAVRGLPVRAVGVDVKAQARAHNRDVADQLGVGGQLSFVASAIGAADVDEPVDLVLALHACDTATDEALARAVRWRAPVILAAPCCHHDIQRQLDARRVPSPYQLVTRHAILKERLGDVLTDALRAAILRLVGYRVEVVEFVDSRHTPRNVLIRAVRTSTGPTDETQQAFRELVSAWAVRPALADMLCDYSPELAALMSSGARAGLLEGMAGAEEQA